MANPVVHGENIVDKFLKIGIDLNNDPIIKLDKIKIPNFYNTPYSYLYNLNGYQQFEFCHTINKIYGEEFLINHLTCYENRNVNIQPNDIIFDCGSNFGLFAAYAATKGAQVYCFEPMSLARIYLKEVQKLYNNLIIVPYAVGKENKITTFIQCDNPAASGDKRTLDFNKNEILYTEQVNLITLDNFINKYNIMPTFIKADIEGAEVDLLEGLQSNFHSIKKFAISIHRDNLPIINHIILDLIPKNFKIYKRLHEYEDFILLGENNA